MKTDSGFNGYAEQHIGGFDLANRNRHEKAASLFQPVAQQQAERVVVLLDSPDFINFI